MRFGIQEKRSTLQPRWITIFVTIHCRKDDLKVPKACFTSQAFRSAVPDLHCTIEDLLVSGDKITARLLFTGTHKGEFMGHPATGKPVSFLAIDILRIRGGRIME
jgi:predicted ester cyclase